MRSYWLSNWGPKLRTMARVRRRISNWPTAVAMRSLPGWQGLRLLHFRDGLNVICRGGTQDWDVVSELAVNDGYELAFEHLKRQKGNPVVLDFGANIGVFSLLAAQRSPGAQIHAYEPAPANLRMLELHRLANEPLAARIQLHPEAVGGQTRMADFFYDAHNPQASRLESAGPAGFKVQIRALAEIMDTLAQPVALVKMDIECAEYEVIQQTPEPVWSQIAGISVELHHNPNGSYQAQDFLRRVGELGFANIRQEKVGGACYFLGRD
jgi:FkbM family methyltransferase